jgi:hypothetical protein
VGHGHVASACRGSNKQNKKIGTKTKKKKDCMALILIAAAQVSVTVEKS